MSGLDAPTKGSVNYDGVNLYQLKEGELAQFRNRNFGIIFQNYNLIQDLTAYENVEVPLLLAKKKNRKIRNPSDLLEMVGLKDKIHTKVSLAGL